MIVLPVRFWSDSKCRNVTLEIPANPALFYDPGIFSYLSRGFGIIPEFSLEKI